MNKRIRFRELDIKDVIKLYEIYSDENAMKYRGSKPIKTLEEAREFVKNKTRKEKDILTIRKAAALTATDELIGTVMYRFNDHKKNECQIGYSIGHQYWKQGFGKEIVQAMLIVIKEEYKQINTIEAWSNEENKASIKILERMGFVRASQMKNMDSCLYLKQKTVSHNENNKSNI